MVYGHSRLTDEHQIARKAARVRQPAQGHQSAQDGDYGIVYVGYAHDGGDHRRRVGLRAGAGTAQGVVLLPEGLKVRGLVVEDLHDLLAVHHLLNIAVQLAEIRLLPVVVGAAAPAAVADVEEHRQIAQRHDEREPPVEHKEQHQRAGHLDEALDDEGEAVVQRVRDGVHVVCEIAHHVAAVPGIEPGKGQALHVCEEVAPDLKEHALRHADHALGIAQRAEHAQAVDAGRQYDAGDKAAPVAPRQAVHDRADHVGTCEVCARAERHEQGRREEQQLVPAHVAQQPLYRIAQALGLLTAPRPHRHPAHPPSSARHRSPDISGRRPGAPRGCPRRVCARPQV